MVAQLILYLNVIKYVVVLNMKIRFAAMWQTFMRKANLATIKEHIYSESERDT